LDKGVELDCQWFDFDDVRFNVQEFVEAHRSASAGLNNAPSCQWSPSPPEELAGVPAEALSANAGFVSFVIFPRHVDIKKIDRTVWLLSTFHAYVSYHVKALDCAKSDPEKTKKVGTKTSFKRLSLKDSRSNSNSKASASWR
uniref:Arp2/3 complex 34 kDa subunit n=1 Tax=Chenopodium quinoa TaxID=63459 RepID=A0A803KUD5_CHEQI